MYNFLISSKIGIIYANLMNKRGWKQDKRKNSKLSYLKRLAYHHPPQTGKLSPPTLSHAENFTPNSSLAAGWG